MKVVVLCGGLGTRLREETEFRPKPMVEIGGRPILWHIMKMYAHYGMREFILCLGYRGNMIKDYFLNYEAMNNDFRISLGRKSHIEFMGAHQEQDFTVTLADTGLETMTGGRLQRVARYLADDDTFLLTYGDGLSDVNIHSLIEFHKSHGKAATVTSVPPISRFGVLETNAQGKVERFAEKPRANGLISAGFFVLNRRIFDYLTGPDCILEREPMERLARDGQLMAYRHDGFFFAMDTFREYQHLNELWASEKTPWKVWTDESDRNKKPMAKAKKAGAE
jgi:glucose-1-phosphate cytidylyltransferase